MTGSVDGTINLWNLNVDEWRSEKEKSFDLGDKSRLLLSIDEVRGCRKTKKIKFNDPSGAIQTEFIQEEVLPLGRQREPFQF